MQIVDLDAKEKKSRRRAVDYNSKTLALVRSWGYMIAKVEGYNVYSNQKTDAFGFIDYLCIRDEDTLGLQACGQDFSAHVHKMTEQRRDAVTAWLRNPSRRLCLIGWRPIKTGKVAFRYEPRVMWFNLTKEGELVWKEQ